MSDRAAQGDLRDTASGDPSWRISRRARRGQRKREDRQFGDDTPERFTASTAAATGRSERTVQREAERGQKLGPDLQRLFGTSLDRASELDALATLPAQEREDLVKRAQNGERVLARKPTSNVVKLDAEAMQANTIAHRLMSEYFKAPYRARVVFDDLYAQRDVTAEMPK